ncbi:unnamed protein product [Ilex paraguariensis]|uniref:Myb/SANT-like domain-containing protein n=1 Tax=Ilex paraguariensis TaxID=185542 RepID=A0ABC8QVK6_9AQUA
MSLQGIEFEETTQWSVRVKEFFIRLMVNEVSMDNLNSSTFHPKIWKKFETEITQQMSHPYAIANLKEQYNRLRTRFRLFRMLLETIGFGWNPEPNTVTTEEAMWQRYLMANLQTKCFHKKGCDHFNLLGFNFQKSTAADTLARASTQIPPTSNEKRELEKEFLKDSSSIKRPFVNLDGGDDFEGPFERPHKKIVSTLSHGTHKDIKSSKMDRALDAWNAYSLERLDKYKRFGDDDLGDDPSHIDTCMDVLESMEDIEAKQYFHVCEKFKDPEWRRMFIKMSAIRRSQWVKSLA